MVMNEYKQGKQVRVNYYLHYELSPFDTMLRITQGSMRGSYGLWGMCDEVV
jgi:hypothetical protein